MLYFYKRAENQQDVQDIYRKIIFIFAFFLTARSSTPRFCIFCNIFNIITGERKTNRMYRILIVRLLYFLYLHSFNDKKAHVSVFFCNLINIFTDERRTNRMYRILSKDYYIFYICIFLNSKKEHPHVSVFFCNIFKFFTNERKTNRLCRIRLVRLSYFSIFAFFLTARRSTLTFL